MTTLTGCPRNDEKWCGDPEQTTVNDLIKISPLKNNFAIGEKIKVIINVPSVNNYFGKEINFITLTENREVVLSNFPTVLNGSPNNLTTFLKGYLNNDGQFIFYNNLNNITYELEFEVQLNDAGVYFISFSDIKPNIFFPSPNCKSLKINTSIEGLTSVPYQITVQ